jgi:hypothetical protein
MKRILYSLATGDKRYENQWIESICSLRRHNRHIPVHLTLYGKPGDRLLVEAERQRVVIVRHASYEQTLQAALPDHARTLLANPTLHKIASMRDIATDCGQVLYLDCDTFCFGDVDRLFDRYGHGDFHAREEPYSRRSPNGYDRAYIDEDAFAALARRERCSFVPAYNTGVMMLNNGIWRRLGNRFPEFIDLVSRLSPNCTEVGRRLPLPTSNTWIVEQVATWLILGRMPKLVHGLFDTTDVAQNGEGSRFLRAGERPLLAHYFSCGQADFFATLRIANAGGASPGLEVSL